MSYPLSYVNSKGNVSWWLVMLNYTYSSIPRLSRGISYTFTLLGRPPRCMHQFWRHAIISRWLKVKHQEPPPIARFMGPTWVPAGADRTQVDHVLAPWTLLTFFTSRGEMRLRHVLHLYDSVWCDYSFVPFLQRFFLFAKTPLNAEHTCAIEFHHFMHMELHVNPSIAKLGLLISINRIGSRNETLCNQHFRHLTPTPFTFPTCSHSEQRACWDTSRIGIIKLSAMYAMLCYT